MTGSEPALTAQRESEEKLRSIFRVAPTGIGVVRDRVLLEVNPRFCEMTGYASEELVGKSSRLLYPTQEEFEFVGREKYRQITQTGSGTVETRWQKKDGAILEILLASTPIDLADLSRGVVFTALDITARKQAEEALRTLSARQEAILSAVPDIIMEVDKEKVYTWANPAGLEFFGEDVIGREAACYFEGEQDTYQIVKPLFTNGSEDVTYVESWQRRKDGEKRLLAWWCRVLKDEHGNVTGALSTGRDVTEIRLTEAKIRAINTDLEQRVEARTRELRQAQERLVRQEKLAVLGQLAGGVAHELRNPLGVISNAVYFLKLTQVDASPEVRKYLGILEQETRTAGKIISDLLDFSRAKSVNREPVSVKRMLQQALERFPTPENIAVEFNIPANLPPVFADPHHMQQVFGNLIVNACQAMPEGGTLCLSARRRGKEIAVSVTDNGEVIPPENMDRLFEPLFTTKARGIGLGLTVSRRLVEANDGRIEAQSNPGAGATFTVYLSPTSGNGRRGAKHTG